MRKIKLTQNKYTIVDNSDFKWLSIFPWYYNNSGYAACEIGGRKNRIRLLMHRVLNATPDGFVTDHVNRNKLDNRKVNLRTVTQRFNSTNRGKSKNNSSGHRGVQWIGKDKIWGAQIKVNYKNIWLGRFRNIKDAIKARKLAELKHFTL